ncbi:MAG TPA: transcriptional regulator [Lentisphaeria bacterium]|nr:MAG: hypothetical protein A2X48_22160 [Lentisphaerae bacterium GWF2_49_21]HBC89304.1 transcriptional regulator [Lentisphaeria bacterium]
MKDTRDNFDATDRKIITLLRDDGRITNNEIARILGVSEGTVRNRIRKLTDDGSIKITGLVNPDFLPEKNLVLVEVKVAVSKDLKCIAEKISILPGVISVYVITGRMDVMVEAFVESKFGLIEFVGKHLASVGGIVSTETHVIMKHYKKWISLNIP